MPTEEDMERIFLLYEPTPETETNKLPETADVSTKEVNINEPCIVIWDTNDKRQWFVGICLADNEDGTYTVEHLERCIPTGKSKLWKYPQHADIQTVSMVQIIPCNIIGSWDMRKRIMTFVLENWEMIDILFCSFY